MTGNKAKAAPPRESRADEALRIANEIRMKCEYLNHRMDGELPELDNSDHWTDRLEELLEKVAKTDTELASELDDHLRLKFTSDQTLLNLFSELVEMLLAAMANLPRENAVRAVHSKVANDPKTTAMTEIREEWERRGRPGAAFAREMHRKYIDTIQSEGSIKNAISRWRGKGNPSS